MTEKRFTLAYEKGDWWAVRDGDITLWKEEVVGLLNQLNDENEELKAKIQLLSTLLDNADAIIDLSNNGMAKAFWKKRNNEVEQEYKMKYKKGDDE